MLAAPHGPARGCGERCHAMSLIYFERIVDLGDAGLLTLTLDSTAYLPLPAGRRPRPCLLACARRSGARPPGSLHARAGTPRAAGRGTEAACVLRRCAGFGEGPHGVGRRATHRHLPRSAHPRRRARRGPCAAGLRWVLRIIDVPAGTVVVEEQVDELGRRLGCRRMYGRSHFDVSLETSGGSWWAMLLGDGRELLTLRRSRIERAAEGLLRKADRGASRLALRPFVAMSRKGPPGLGSVSASGRYAVCSDMGSAMAIVDLQRLLRAGWLTSWDLGGQYSALRSRGALPRRRACDGPRRRLLASRPT